jgi:lipoprotein-anchoring transpeptidase ErfK/SrfK
MFDLTTLISARTIFRMATSPTSKRSRWIKFSAAAFTGAVLVAGFAASGHADDGVIVLTPPSTTVPTAPPTTTSPSTTTTEAPLPTLPTATVAPTAAPTSTSPAIVPPTTAPSTPTPTQKPTKPTIAPKPPTTQPRTNPNASGPASIEIDISRQTLYLRKGGVLVRSLHVSTGSGRHFCDKGKCQTAHTPRGRFRIQGRINGWRTSSLGRLYNPLYFSGGYAIHGAGSVPNHPASHGCVRITMGAAGWLPRQVPNGTPVWIHD